MKKLACLFCILLAVSQLLFSQQIAKNSKITVAPPLLQNMDESEQWIAFFVQGQLTSDLQNYSDYIIIDRVALQPLTGEQERLEVFAETNNNNIAIQYAELIAADYCVSVNIIKKEQDFSLDCKILEVRTSRNIGKAYSNSNVSLESLENGFAVHCAAYNLLKSIGISNARLSELKKIIDLNSKNNAKILAQTNVAKGILAEQNGSNIEALTYYIKSKKSDKKFTEASLRMKNIIGKISSGNFGAEAKNLIKLRKDWDKLLLAAAEFIAANPPEFALKYFSDVELEELTEDNYENESVTMSISCPYLWQIDDGEENRKIVAELLAGLHSIPESKNWGDKINCFPWTYGEELGTDNWLYKAANNKTEDYSFIIALLDSNKLSIAEKQITLSIQFEKRFCNFYTFGNSKRQYTLRRNFGKSPVFYTPSTILFGSINAENADTEKIFVCVNQSEGNGISIIPVSEEFISERQALRAIKSGEHKGTLKIAGFINPFYNGYDYGKWKDSLKNAKRNVSLDFTQTVGITDVHESAFEGCEKLSSIILPNTIKYIEEYAFAGTCESLKKVVLPSTLVEFSDRIFDSNQHVKGGTRAGTFVTDVYFKGTKQQWDALNARFPLIKAGSVSVICDYK